jgi:hypothetical protein
VAGWLRSGGRLVSMQPIGRPIPFHVRRGGRIEPVGVVYATDAGQRDMRSSRQALAESIRAGLFTPRAELSRVLEFHYHSEDDWNEFLKRPRTGAVEADPDVLAGALAALSREDAVIVALEETVFSACDRAGARRGGRDGEPAVD